MSRLVRAPIFFIGLILSFVPASFIFATVTVGEWIERGLGVLHIRPKRGWPFLVLGAVTYALLGLVIPIYVGSLPFGVIGAIVAPILVLVLVAKLGRW